MSEEKHKLAKAPAHEALPVRVNPVVADAMQRMGDDPDPAALRELLALQREWEAGEAKRAYTQAMVALKADLPRVLAKDATVDFTNREGVRTYYTHTSLAAAMDAVVPILTAHGFSLSWTPATSKGSVSVTCRLTHCQGHAEESTLEAAPDSSGRKSGPQAIASTITLLERYTALALLGIATKDMREPQDDPASAAHVDAMRNLKAVQEITKRGLKLDDAIAQLEGRTVDEWTAEDLKKLKGWIKAADTPRERQPGED